MTENEKKWGGKREGSGRPFGDKMVNIAFRVKPEWIKEIREMVYKRISELRKIEKK